MALPIRYQLLLTVFIFFFYSSMVTPTSSTTVELNDMEDEEEEIHQEVNVVVTGKPQNITVETGEVIKLTCPVEGIGGLGVNWLLKDKVLNVGPWIKDSRASVNGTVIEINGAKLSDSGEISCEIAVHPVLKITHFVTVHPAGFVLSPGHPITLKINQSDSVKLFCDIEIGPKQTITWSYQEEGKKPMKLTETGQIYKVTEVNMKHNGTYTCEIEGEMADKAFATANLIVVDKVELLSKSEETMDAPVGAVVTLECKFKGNPTPSIRWTFNGKEYPSGDNQDKLIINGVTQSHVGKYQCILNSQEELTRTIMLRVQQKDYNSDVLPSVATSPSLMIALLGTILLSFILS